MSFFSFFLVELKRIFRTKSAWLALVLTACAPLGGYSWYVPVPTLTKASALIANPAMTGALLGAVFFALLTLYELDRVHRSETVTLTDTIVSPLTLNGARVLALMAPALVAVLLAMTVYLPYTMLEMKNIFVPELYIASFLVLMLPSLFFGILAAAALYHVTYRVDLSFVLFVVFALLSMSQWFSDDFILRWVNPLIPIYSDDFSNVRILRMATYNRLFWLTVLSGCYLLSLLCIRRYGRGILSSLCLNARKICLSLLAALMVCSGCFAYVYQPYIDHSPMDYVQTEGIYSDNMFWKSTKVDLILNTKKGTLQGRAVYEIENDNTEPQECRFRVNPGYEISSVTVNGEAIPFTDLNNDTNNNKEVSIMLPAEPELRLAVEYGGFPQEWSMNRMDVWGDEVGDRYVNLGGTALAPRLSMRTKAEDIPIIGTITLPSNLTLIPTGNTAKLVSDNADGTKTWLAVDKGTQINLFAGDYVMEVIEAGGMHIEFYYSKKHEEAMRRADAKQVMAEVVEYCTAHYGPLPYGQDLPLKIIQTSAYLMGGGAYGNFSVMGESFFSDVHLNNPNSLEGATSSEVLAHEIIHQWWGLSASVLDEKPWSSEGLTVYTTYRMMKEKFGEAYVQKYYLDQWKAGLDALNRSFYRRHPEYMDILPEKYTARIRAQEESAQMYQIMPLNILKAAELMGGEDKLDNVLAQLYENGGTEMPPYITYNDFLNACGLTKEAISVE